MRRTGTPRPTPGPWYPKWDFEKDSKGRRSGRSGYAVIYNTRDFSGQRLAEMYYDGTEEEKIANATLMSAAPLLLAFAAIAIRAACVGKRLSAGEIKMGMTAIEAALHYETPQQFLRRALSVADEDAP